MVQRSIPRFVDDTIDDLSQRRLQRTPFISSGVASSILGREVISLGEVEAKFGHLRMGAVLDLPRDRAPYMNELAVHRFETTIARAFEMARGGRAVSVAQVHCGSFDGLLPATHPNSNFWMGNVSSGLHWDNADNYLIQLDGTRVITMASTKYVRELRPLSDNISKSALSPKALTEGHPSYPKCVDFWKAELRPGDVLFIPRRWWHCLDTKQLSLAINIWHGVSMSRADRLFEIVRLGPQAWTRTAVDFVMTALGKRRANRVFSPRATGEQLYDDFAHFMLGRLTFFGRTKKV